MGPAQRSEKTLHGRFRLPISATISLAFCVGLVGAFALSTVVRHQAGYHFWLDGILYVAAGASPLLLCAFRFRRDEGERRAFVLLALALLAWTIGNVVNAIYANTMDIVPVPAWSDLFWLLFYPLAYAGALLLLRSRRKQISRGSWLDGVSCGAGLASLAAAFVFGPIAQNAAGTRLGIAVSLAYPILDLCFVVLVGFVWVTSGGHLSRSWKLLLVGILSMATGDVVYLYRVATSRYVEGTPYDILWTAGALLIGAAVLLRESAEDTSESSKLRPGLAVSTSIFFAFTSIVVLFVDRYIKFSAVASIFAVLALLSAVIRCFIAFRDVHTIAESRLEARTDELTGLGNRRQLMESAAVLTKGTNTALLLLDLNRFKEINDSLGHDAGDEILRIVGSRLRSCVSRNDILARLGGDEFALLLTDADELVAQSVAKRITEALLSPVTVDGIALSVSASIGIACSGPEQLTTKGLLKRADIAMYKAKRSENNYSLFTGKDDHGRDRLVLVQELRTAIESHALTTHYQPTICAKTGVVQGFEALVRWNHPTRGSIPPAEFVPLAESFGLISILTDAVIEQVLRDANDWNGDVQPKYCSINLSVSNLLDHGFVRRVEQALAIHNVNASCLQFEITENVILSDPERAKSSITALRNLGARVSLDDYGTGYSSIAYLRQLPLDELKLDRSFVSALADDPAAATFVSTAKQLADALGLSLVAEGIESGEVWQQIRAIGCDLGQGYYFAKPMPASEISAFLHAHEGRLHNDAYIATDLVAALPTT